MIKSVLALRATERANRSNGFDCAASGGFTYIQHTHNEIITLPNLHVAKYDTDGTVIAPENIR